MISYRLFQHVEALELIMREIQGLFSIMTLLTLKQGSKVKFHSCKTFKGHDFIYVVFTFPSPRVNNRGNIRPFQYDYPT